MYFCKEIINNWIGNFIHNDVTKEKNVEMC
jgi:hypothetical protein